MLKGWKEIPIGGIIDEPGKSREYKTGTWRVLRPILHIDKCVHCMFCWLYCPDMAIVIDAHSDKKPKMVGFNYDYCKGCGLCADVCPTKAIEMRPETEFVEE